MENNLDECMKLEADYNAFAGKLERVKRVGPSKPRSARTEGSRAERRRSTRAAWIEAFETRPSETAKKILNHLSIHAGFLKAPKSFGQKCSGQESQNTT